MQAGRPRQIFRQLAVGTRQIPTADDCDPVSTDPQPILRCCKMQDCSCGMQRFPDLNPIRKI